MNYWIVAMAAAFVGLMMLLALIIVDYAAPVLQALLLL